MYILHTCSSVHEASKYDQKNHTLQINPQHHVEETLEHKDARIKAITVKQPALSSSAR